MRKHLFCAYQENNKEEKADKYVFKHIILLMKLFVVVKIKLTFGCKQTFP